MAAMTSVHTIDLSSTTGQNNATPWVAAGQKTVMAHVYAYAFGWGSGTKAVLEVQSAPAEVVVAGGSHSGWSNAGGNLNSGAISSGDGVPTGDELTSATAVDGWARVREVAVSAGEALRVRLKTAGVGGAIDSSAKVVVVMVDGI